MKKLKFEKGTIAPFWLQDLEYMQEGIEEALKGIVEGLLLTSSSCIISGCKVTQDNSKISMTSGWAYHQGEILPVKALPETEYSASQVINLKIKTEYDNTGSRIILKENENFRANPYEINCLEPVLSTENGFIVRAGTLNLMEEIIQKCSVKEEDSGWITPFFTKDFLAVGDISSIKCRTKGNMTQIFGEIKTPAGNLYNFQDAIEIFDVPSPLQDIRMLRHTCYNKDEIIIDIIKKDRKMIILNMRPDDLLYLDGIMYFSGGNI